MGATIPMPAIDGLISPTAIFALDAAVRHLSIVATKANKQEEEAFQCVLGILSHRRPILCSYTLILTVFFFLLVVRGGGLSIFPSKIPKRFLLPPLSVRVKGRVCVCVCV